MKKTPKELQCEYTFGNHSFNMVFNKDSTPHEMVEAAFSVCIQLGLQGGAKPNEMFTTLQDAIRRFENDKIIKHTKPMEGG